MPLNMISQRLQSCKPGELRNSPFWIHDDFTKFLLNLYQITNIYFVLRLLGIILDKTFLETFSLFSTICFHCKWNQTRLLSPESGCTSCLTSCWTTKDIGPEEIRKFQKNPWNAWVWWQVPSRPPKSQILTFFSKKLQKISRKTFHRKTYFA